MKEIIILGDVEMGCGTYTDDFVSDKLLSKLILELSNKKNDVDLVFNGDSFDFLKCPIILEKEFIGKGKITKKKNHHYPRHICKDTSLAKLNLIYNAHKEVFDALSYFVSKQNKHLFFVIGNHDADLMFKQVRSKLKKLIGGKNNRSNVHFPGLKYQHNEVLAEHGHMYDYLNKIDPKYWYLTYKGKKILNIPWVSFSIVSNFLDEKEKNPVMERIFPRQEMFAKHTGLLHKLTLRGFIHLMMSILYYPVRYHYDPTYTYPKELLREFYRRIKKTHWDVDKIMHKFQKVQKKRKRRYKIHVLGHIHDKYFEAKDGEVFIHPGSWRDEYDLNSETGMLEPRQKSYVKIIVDEERLDYELVHLDNNRTPLVFNDVKDNEHKFIELIKEDELKSVVFR
ncbi:hypothetical protein HN385_05180 [archaeon]|jgi:Icc-related predicted phosphoesterase|nr:hypothetical protein [archaeon]MBT3451413.1 hypothetical protein [archaeon]MBT6869242.1 hypothetical protein [archaeon]MBT7193640.1 hypothetical protein [archaeon]MBT7380258.1 hypothetical protein [archaeon]